MGGKKRMDIKDNKIILYTSQRKQILNILEEYNIYFPKIKYIKEKYGEVSHAFLYAYTWFRKYASKIVPPPEHSESAVWTFCEKEYVSKYPDSNILKLLVPISEVIFFKMSDWNKILNYKLIPDNELEEKSFEKKLQLNGIGYEGDIFLKPYYPALKKEVINSWHKLFKYDASIKNGIIPNFSDLQGAIWKIKYDWIQEVF